jgi:hypothetical protein
VVATNYKGSRDVHVPTGRIPNGLDVIHGAKAKNGDVAPRQILHIRLFQRFPLIPDEFGHGTSSIRSFISLPFQGVQERLNWVLYATWASVLMWTTPGYRTCFGNSGRILF